MKKLFLLAVVTLSFLPSSYAEEKAVALTSLTPTEPAKLDPKLNPIVAQQLAPFTAVIRRAVEENMKAAAVPETPKIEKPAPVVEKKVEAPVVTAPVVAAPVVATPAPVKYYKVWRVYNGDILRLSNDQRVVMIGVDTPEPNINRKLYDEARRTGQKMESIKKAGQIAMGVTRGLTQGKWVRLEFDEEMRDEYGRMLAYVFLPDGTFVNAELIRRGYARAVPGSSINRKYDALFKSLETQAKAERRGFWANVKEA